MIYAFTGKTGSGKTYNMVSRAYSRWLRGVDVYSNTLLFFQPSFIFRLRDLFYHFILKKSPPLYGRIRYFENISEILEVQDGLILFDEAQVLFNARQWESLPDEFQYKLQQHRKHNLDLYCTTQNMMAIDITYRRLVQVWYHHESLLGLGKPLIFGLFRRRLKDIDQLFNSVDDIAVSDLDVSFFTIGRLFFWRPNLYDTLYDVGFKRYKTLCLSQFNESLNKFQTKYWILPKKMSLADGQRLTSSIQSSFSQKIYRSFKRT